MGREFSDFGIFSEFSLLLINCLILRLDKHVLLLMKNKLLKRNNQPFLYSSCMSQDSDVCVIVYIR